MNSILLVEDEKNLGLTLKEYLEKKNYTVFWAQSLKEAREIFKRESSIISILLLDIGLPDGSGLELGKEFREQNKNIVLLFLSAQNDPDIRLLGLELGADDYITKPFNLKELLLRINRIISNQIDNHNFPPELRIGPLKIWFSKYELQDADGQIWPMGQKEMSILKILYQNINEVVSREKIIDDVWGEDSFPSYRTVDNYIVKIRKWCDTDEQQNLMIKSIRGVGYKLIKK